MIIICSYLFPIIFTLPYCLPSSHFNLILLHLILPYVISFQFILFCSVLLECSSSMIMSSFYRFQSTHLNSNSICYIFLKEIVLHNPYERISVFYCVINEYYTIGMCIAIASILVSFFLFVSNLRHRNYLECFPL